VDDDPVAILAAPLCGYTFGTLATKTVDDAVRVAVGQRRLRPVDLEPFEPLRLEFREHLDLRLVRDVAAARGIDRRVDGRPARGTELLPVHGFAVAGLDQVLDNLPADLVAIALANDLLRHLARAVALHAGGTAHGL